MPGNGFEIYSGPSAIDGAPIVAILTGMAIASANPKTGGAPLMTWILSRDIDPIVAVSTGADRSICGTCPHRGWIDPVGPRNLGRSCYVQHHAGVRNTWLAYKRGNYPATPMLSLPLIGHNMGLRLGAYGDPAAVPVAIWKLLTLRAAWHLGFTHQWRGHIELQGLCMASVDSVSERDEARALGWRTFRVRSKHESLMTGEVICPASAEKGHAATCSECRACSGRGGKARADIVIIAHGTLGRSANFERRHGGPPDAATIGEVPA